MATKREISKENTISAIMAAAAAEFSESGYKTTTIRSIAARVGVASGLVCTYFDTKENLLCRIINRYKPDIIFEGIYYTDPYNALCTYLDHIRALQRKDPVQFNLHLKVTAKTGFPDSVYDVIRDGFAGSKLETAIRTAQNCGQLIKGDPFKVFEILSGTAYSILHQCSEMGSEAPDDDAILNIIGYKHIVENNAHNDVHSAADSDPFADFTINADTMPMVTKLCERIPGGFFIYHADGDRELIFFNSFMVSMYGCDNAEEFRELTGNSFRGLVHPDDYARSEASIAEQIGNDSRNIDHITYRFIRKDGSVGILDDYGHFSRSESFGDIYYVFVQDITKECRDAQRAKQLDLLNQVLVDYDGVFLIDCENDTRKTFHDRLSGAANYDDAENYSSAFARYVDTFVCAPDHEMMKRFAEPSNMLKALGDRKELAITYRDKTTGTQRFYEMKIVRYSDTEVLQSFRENDAEMVNSFLFEKLKDNYFAIFGVDLETGLMRSYKDDPLHVAGREGEITTLSAAMLKLASLCEGNAKGFFEQCSDVQFIKKRFAEEDRAEFLCKSLHGDRSKWVDVTGIVFSRNEDGVPSLFCFAFNYLDESSARVQELQAQLNAEAKHSELLFDTFNAGKWRYEISADDEVVSADYSDAVHRNTNIPSFSGQPMGWLEKVHPDDRDRAREAFMAPVFDHSGKTKYDVDFRIIDSEGKIRWTKSAGRVIRREDGTGEYFGMNIDITEEIRTQQEHQKQIMLLREQEAITEQFIDNFVSQYDIAYKVNAADDSCVLLKSKGMKKGSDRVFSFFSQANDYMISELVYEKERDRVRHELERENIRRKLAEHGSFSIEYRVMIDGVTRWDNMTFIMIDENSFVAGFKARNEEIILNHLQEKEYENYYALFAIDLDTAQMTTLKNTSGYSIGETGAAVPFSMAMGSYANLFEGEARDFFTRMSDVENVKADHANDDKLTYVYKAAFDDEDRWMRATSYVIARHDDGTPAVLTLGFNIMDSMGADRQEMERKLRDALEEAQAANRAKSTFLFNMSHDIRTPMNAIIGFTNIAQKHIDDREKVEDCLEKTRKSGNMLLSLINSVLEVSRIESGHATVEEQYGDIYYSFANIESTMREMAETKDIDLSFDFGNIRDRFVYADFGRCMRIFLNVISNAIKYTPDGGAVRVRCEQESEAIDGYARYRYTVRDNGIGMSEEYLGRIYEQFSRENNTTVSGIQGSGLGMSVVRSFVDLMGGTIDIRSRKGEGTEVIIILPFRLQEEAKYTDPNTGEIIGAGASAVKVDVNFRGKKALLVEDNELNREIVEELLEDESMIVESAADGSDAVEMLRDKGPDYYDFILMDIQMPKMNGYEATKAIRAMYPDANLPIIAVSANAFEEDKAMSKAAGMNDHVSKPISIDMTVEKVRYNEPTYYLEPQIIDVLMQDPVKGTREIAMSLNARFSMHGNDPVFIELGRKLEALKEQHAQQLINATELLKALLQLAAETVQAERTVAPEDTTEQGKAALTELFNEVQNARTPVIVKRIVDDIDNIVRLVRFPNWQKTTKGVQDIQSELLRIIWVTYKIKDREIIDKAYAYVEQYY